MRLALFLILLSTFIVTTDGRSIIDPIGGGTTGVTADSGGGMDPNGGATNDTGSCIDPNG